MINTASCFSTKRDPDFVRVTSLPEWRANSPEPVISPIVTGNLSLESTRTSERKQDLGVVVDVVVVITFVVVVSLAVLVVVLLLVMAEVGVAVTTMGADTVHGFLRTHKLYASRADFNPVATNRVMEEVRERLLPTRITRTVYCDFDSRRRNVALKVVDRAGVTSSTSSRTKFLGKFSAKTDVSA